MLLLLAACAGATPSPRSGPAPRPPYAAVHHRWTRELKLYEDLETRLILRATLRTEEQRTAGAALLAWRAALPADEAARLHGQALADLEAVHEVVFTAMRGPIELRGFHLAEVGGAEVGGAEVGGAEEGGAEVGGAEPTGRRDAAWQVRLEVDGVPCPAQGIEQVEEPGAAWQVLYPQLNPWADLWVARFDAATCGRVGPAVLFVSGAGGAGAVRWDLPG